MNAHFGFAAIAGRAGRAAAAVALLLACAAQAALAETARQLMWDGLVPPAPPIENPFTDLSMEQRDDIGFIMRTRADLRQGYIDSAAPEVREAEVAAQSLAAVGVDVDKLTAEAEKLRQEVERRNSAVKPELDGAFVRMPGYALPLEFDGTGVTEFLLVPYVGACIHTPPPPSNQVVVVRLTKPYVVEDLYAAVWVTGRMRVEAVSRALSYVDGVADVSAGYALDAVTVEPYGG
ncbi:MAG: DUF3299 domain-containing protein [Alphaproteobacteria bacterium]